MPRVLLALLILSLAPGALPARTLVFSAKYAAGGDWFARLGHYDLSNDGTGKLTYWIYQSSKDYRSFNARGRKYPGPASPPPWNIQIPRYVQEVPGIARSWVEHDGVLTVKVGTAQHTWQTSDTGGYALAGMGSFTSANGYAHETESLRPVAKLTKEHFLPSYAGEYWTKFLHPGGAYQWELQRPSLNPYLFSYDAKNDALYYRSTDQGMMTETALALNYAPASPLFVYQSGGHDFNRNNVLDEYGHAFQWLGAFQGGQVVAWVFVEYSFQSAGTPILSAGHYYQP